MKISILAYNKCTSSMIVGVMDILSLANVQSGKKLFEIDIVTMTGEAVNSFNGFPITPTKTIRAVQNTDLIYVPGFLGDADDVVRNENKAINWLRKRYDAGTKMLAACNGNVFLAEAGILEGKEATTHWSLKDHFHQKYPNVDLKPERIIVDNGDVICAAGVTAYMNLALYLIARFGTLDLASICSKVFLVDGGRRVQTPYLIFNAPKNHGDLEIARIQEWIEGNYVQHISLEGLLIWLR